MGILLQQMKNSRSDVGGIANDPVPGSFGFDLRRTQDLGTDSLLHFLPPRRPVTARAFSHPL